MQCESMSYYTLYKEIMPLYLDGAKTSINLSSGALGLTVVFREKIIGSQPGSRVSSLTPTSWFLFLLTIGASALYQYMAVKFLVFMSGLPGPPQPFLVRNPGWVFGAMLLFFSLASASLAAAAWRQLRMARC